MLPGTAFRSIVDKSPNFIYVFRESDGNLVYQNHSSEDLRPSGTAEGEAISLQAMRASFGLGNGANPHEPLEGMMRHVVRGELHVKTTIIRDATESGEVLVSFVATELDTRQVLERTLDYFLMNTQDLVMMIGFDGAIHRLSPSWENLGYKLEQLHKGSHLDLIHPDDHQKAREAFGRLKRGRQVRNLETRYRHVAGDYVWFAWNALPLESEQLIVMQGVDITWQKLQEEQLLSAKGSAELASTAKSEFLSRMSHELRTPLNSILGFAQLLDMSDLSDEQRENLSYILKSGRYLLNLINEVLDITRIESGRISLSPEPVAVLPLLREVVSVLRPMAEAEKLNVLVDGYSEVEIFATADREKLKQVFMNLMNNAIKYNRTFGSIHVQVSVEGEVVRIIFEDTGIGMARHHQHLVFQPFERLGMEATGKEGTGLGLALSKRLIEAMNGRIWFESETGVGTKFVLELGRAQENGSEALAIPEPMATQTRESRGKVLYIEDNFSNLNLVKGILRMRPGVELLTAMQGSIGLALARQHRPDLVLLDMNLPDMHGTEVLQIMIQDEELRRIPVVIISADATPKQVEQALALGAEKYMTKPLDVAMLLGVIDERMEAGNEDFG